MKLNRCLIPALAILGLAACSTIAEPERVSSVHDDMLVLDSHLDTPVYFHSEDYDFSARGSWEEDGTHVDLPRMNEGGLDGGFWVIFTSQGPLTKDGYKLAFEQAMLRMMSIREFAAKYDDDVGLVFTVDEALKVAGEGRKIAFISMENSYPLGESVEMLDVFYTAGLRMIAPVHFRNNQFADSATDIESPCGGLCPDGQALVRRAVELGMLLDGSHASDDTVRDMMALSPYPIILSHTGPKTVYDHPRNIPDELLLELAADGGVIQINAYGGYLEKLEPTDERAAALKALSDKHGEFSAMSKAQIAAYRAERRVLDAEFPPPRSTYEKFIEHLVYTLELIGPDHVGIGADWDGGGGVDGMSDITFLPKVTDTLLSLGYSETDIEKIWSGNMLRIMRLAESAKTREASSPATLN